MSVLQPNKAMVTGLADLYDRFDDYRTKHEFRLTPEDRRAIAAIRVSIRKFQNSLEARAKAK